MTGLVLNGDKQDEDVPGGMLRLQAVRTLCQMNPSQALNVRTLCVRTIKLLQILYISNVHTRVLTDFLLLVNEVFSRNQ